MQPDVVKELNKETQESELNEALLQHCRALVKISRAEMSKRYSDWDLQDLVFRGLRPSDAEDKKNAEQDKPVKMVIPHTYAQVMTFVSFLFLMYNQNDRFFELEPQGDKDYGKKREDCETILQRDLKKNKWNGVLFQHLLDVAKFGVGILECSWTKQTAHIYVTPEPMTVTVNGVSTTIQPPADYQDFVKFEGNLLRPISPYKFFPDTRLPLTEFQRGEFCASEEEYTKSQLRALENQGEVAGVEHIQPLTKEILRERGDTRASINSQILNTAQGSQSEGLVLVTKVQVWITPSKFKFGNDQTLGPETFPILYHVWYANDNRVIRVEPTGYWHQKFSWTVAQFTPDMHHTMNLGLADLIHRLQDVISWFINSHISSVRRVMQNRLVVNPAIIDTASLDGEGDIYIRKGVSAALMERAVHQLQVQDVTGGHVDNVQFLGQLMEVVTGVNGNAMGQYNSGRRSAQEARIVTAGSAGRMKTHGHLIWESSLGELAQLMLSNLRQSLSPETFAQVIDGQSPEDLMQRFMAFKGTPQEIVSSDDYFTFDSTLASEKGFAANGLQELLVAIMSNPQAAQQLDLDPRALLQEVNDLRGLGPVKRFSLSQNIQNGATPLPQVLPQTPQVPPTI